MKPRRRETTRPPPAIADKAAFKPSRTKPAALKLVEVGLWVGATLHATVGGLDAFAALASPVTQAMPYTTEGIQHDFRHTPEVAMQAARVWVESARPSGEGVMVNWTAAHDGGRAALAAAEEELAQHPEGTETFFGHVTQAANGAAELRHDTAVAQQVEDVARGAGHGVAAVATGIGALVVRRSNKPKG